MAEAARTFSAGRALTAALMFIKLNQTGNSSDDVSLRGKKVKSRVSEI